MSSSKFDTDLPADSVEFCPQPLARDVLACGTYKLEEQEHVTQKQRRLGKCLIFSIDQDDNLSKLQEFPLPAILDMKWCHTMSSPPVLGIADAEGNVSLHEWSLTERTLTSLATISCASSDVLCLSLDWSNRRCPGDARLGSLIVSLSDGSLTLLKPTESTIAVTDSWRAHDHEPWIAAWDYWNSNVVFSGGDDLKMKGWDLRQGFQSPTFVNKKFEGGVTTIQSHPYIEHIIAVGSYDHTVRLFDTRKPFVPLMQADVGGGAWRVKWHPDENLKSNLLVACMHDGFKILEFDLDVGCTVNKRFDKHESLAYGADWSLVERKQGGSLVASCSFYDHTLHLWRG